MDFLVSVPASDKRASRSFYEALFPNARAARERAEYDTHMKAQREAAK